MPKVIVYVPARAWRMLEERGLDPAATVREFAKRGYEVSEAELTERDEALRGKEPSAEDGASSKGSVGRSRSVNPDPHFKPDPK